MKLLAAVLALANLALLGWSWWIDVERAPPPQPPPADDRWEDVARLTLLEEAGRSRVAAKRASCVRIGPLEDETAAVALAARLAADGTPVRRLREDVPAGPPDYQVYLPPLPSLEQARRTTRELTALDVEAYVMSAEEVAGAVSLGLFTSRERAEARREAVAELGYDVRIRALERSMPRWYVVARGAVESVRARLPARGPGRGPPATVEVACPQGIEAPDGRG